MNIKFTSIILSFVLILSSCQKDLKIGQEDFEARLVVNSIFSPDSLWSINVSTTKNIFDSESQIENIVDAKVILEDRSLNIDIPIENLGNGVYSSIGFLPKEGHQYEIFVQKEGYERAHSFTYVPSYAKVEISKKEVVNTFNDVVYKLSIDIEDDPNQQNYYVWEIVTDKKNAGVVYKEEEFEELQDFLSSSFPVNQPKTGINTALSADGIFNGSSYSEEFFIVPSGKVTDGPGSGPIEVDNERLYLKVKSVSQDLYLYHESLKSYKNSANVNTSISSPLSIFSNIENGLGLFGAYSETIIPID